MKSLKKNFPLILFLLCTGFVLNAQNAQQHLHSHGTPHQECATHATQGQLDYMNRTLRERQSYVDNGRSGTIYIPVRHIIVRKTDGTGGISNTNLQNAMDGLNAAYAVANVQFYECSRAYVNDDTYYTFETSEEAALAAAYEVSNVVNVFHCNTVSNGAGSSYCGYAYYPGGADRIFMANGCTTNGSTLIHEFGHYFSVRHTHNAGNELVNGSNCSTAGDQICDTPADPNLSGKVNGSCVYTGTDVDANGDSYTPQTTNYMSYSRKSCRTVFTPGQIARLRYSAINDRAYLTCSCFTYDFVGSHNLGTDVTSHNYTVSANTSLTTVYNCDSDPQQLRVGSCSASGGDFVSVEFDVPAGTDKLRLLLKGGWQNNHSEVHIDGQYQRDFTLSTTNCSSGYTYVYVYNISNHTQDGKVVIKLVDPEAGCTGDFNIDYMYVYAANCNQSGYAKIPYFTNFNSGVLDNYWLTQSSNEFGRAELTNANGPYSGAYHLVMDVNTNNNYATNQADLRVDLSGCTSPKILFRWKEFLDETHTQDGVYLSDDGGENFVKVHDLTGAANNTWTAVTLDLAALATANSLTLSEEFVIRFQQYDNYGATTDGIAIDYVYVYGCNNVPSPMVMITDNDRAKGDVLSVYPGSGNETNDALTTSVEKIANKAEVDLFPNPANQIISLNFRQFKADDELTVKVISMLGAVQYTTTHTINNAQSDILELSVEQLPAGVYSVIIENATTTVTNKPFVIKR
ncbi:MULTISPECIES: M43 family zinc metalloprotease [unclassified Aureispira]|uniref:M43 family zinc metalloprotease n=1 Tax=unclassified Aureispira TaxID=2649989 RepID=UPI000695EE36|nr:MULTISPECIES: M43 family zinc metalloprotease [unclassified Aureispira]WMX17260.1 M43 family zinc metalloprotease [Aureispira sp. CCB-E]